MTGGAAAGLSAAVVVGSRPGGEEIVLVPTGWGRFPAAAFLAFWLCGWAAGEAVALGILLSPLGGESARQALSRWGLRFSAGPSVPIPVLLFVALWTLLWTIGGVAAAGALLRILAGRDVFLLPPEGGFSFRRGVGRFGRVRTVPRSAGDGIRIRLRRRDRALVAVEGGKETLLTSGGTLEDRQWLAGRLRAAVGAPAEGPGPTGGRQEMPASEPPPPAGWEVERLSRGGVVLSAGPAPFRRTWQAAPGAISFRGTAFGFARVERTFSGGRLAVDVSTDSDGDEWFELKVVAPEGTRSVCRRMNGAPEVVAWGRFLSYHSRLPLDVAREALPE